MTPEGKIKTEIKKYLDSLGDLCWYFMPAMNGYGRKGIPDIVGCFSGVFFAFEVKSAEGKATPWQERELEKILKTGSRAAIVRNVADVDAIISELRHGI